MYPASYICKTESDRHRLVFSFVIDELIGSNSIGQLWQNEPSQFCYASVGVLWPIINAHGFVAHSWNIYKLEQSSQLTKYCSTSSLKPSTFVLVQYFTQNTKIITKLHSSTYKTNMLAYTTTTHRFARTTKSIMTNGNSHHEHLDPLATIHA